ncbi:MAG: Xaa-Pro peptidase family protein, partial [Planctomycetaceae bacterium]|nr:Xaa-Pro peptidase family protein [Planctomycetaceae bacterium]
MQNSKTSDADRFSIRRDKIISNLSKRGIDGLLVTNPINVRYLTGFTGGDGYLLLKKQHSVLISDGRYSLQIQEECQGIDVLIASQQEVFPKSVCTQINKQTGKIGIESESITLMNSEKLKAASPNTEFVPTINEVASLRQIKDQFEISEIRKAIVAAHNAFTDVRNMIAKGELGVRLSDVSELSVRDELEYRLRKHGASEKSFASIVCSGQRAALPHGIPTANTIGKESHLLIDWGAIVNGYMSDLTRVIILKENNKKLKDIYNIVLKAQTEAIKAIKPGVICQEIDAIARGIISDSGYAKNFNHGLGHSFGLEIHENPRFNTTDKTVLKTGMVMTVEPGIYIKG